MIAPFTLSLVILFVACGGNASPAATDDLDRPTAETLKQAGQGLFDTFAASMQSQDAAALHGIFVADLRERCTVEQMQDSLISGDASFPNAEVKTVYLDLQDSTRALMQLVLVDQPEGNPGGLASGFAFAFPFPMLMEEGEWRLSFPSLAIVPQEGCPFAGSTSSQGASITAEARRVDATPQPAFPRLAPPPGVRALASGSGGSGEYNASVLLQTDMTLKDLIGHYRQEVLQPDWKFQHDLIEERVAAFSWTFLDEPDQPGFGTLVITPGKEGQWWVRLWIGGGTGIQTFALREGQEPPASAPPRPE